MSDALDAPPRPLKIAEQLRRFLGVANLVMAMAVTASLSYNIADRATQDALIPSHYFHFVTVQTTLLQIVVLVVGGLAAIRRPIDSPLYSAVRACTVTYALVVGVVFHLLLSSFPPADGYVPELTFPSDMQHTWTPLFLVVEWVAMPGRVKLGSRVVALGMLYPIIWTLATAVRGTSGDGWFPYFFLNPEKVGALGVAGFLATLIAIFIIAFAATISIGRLHRKIGIDALSMRS